MLISLKELELFAMVARSLGIKLPAETKWTCRTIQARWIIRYPEQRCDIDAKESLEVHAAFPRVLKDSMREGNWTGIRERQRSRTSFSDGSLIANPIANRSAEMKKILHGLSATSLALGILYAFGGGAQTSWSQSGGIPPVAPPSSVSAIAPAHAASAGTTAMASAILSNGFQQVVLFDQTKSTIAVYHVDPTSGDIQLKSVRKVDADFALQEFNLSEPTPSTIRKNVR
jgi:hypothetical protein